MRRFAGMMVAFCLLLAGCAASPVPAQPYLDDLEAVLSVRAKISARYAGALEAVLTYARAPTPETLEEARAACVSAMEEIAGEAEIESALTEEQRTAMAELGMDQADYATPFRMQEYEKAARLQNLADLLSCLNEEPPDGELAACLAEMNLDYEGYDWQIEVAAVNILLAQVPEEELGEFRETFLPGLAALGGETLEWETDRDILEERAEAVFGRLEERIEAFARETGERYLQLLSKQRDLAEELEAAGMDGKEAEGLAREIGRLEEAAK